MTLVVKPCRFCVGDRVVVILSAMKGEVLRHWELRMCEATTQYSVRLDNGDVIQAGHHQLDVAQ